MTLPFEAPETGTALEVALGRSGYALLQPTTTRQLTGLDHAGWSAMHKWWSQLPRDTYLKDGGDYRARRHASVVQDLSTGELTLAPHRAHWQPTAYNALHGGMSRWFEPLESSFSSDAGLRRCITSIGECVARVRAEPRWFIEVHQVRIDTAGGIGRPTPEGAHRDGVDFVAVWLAGREGVRGGETRVFEADGPYGIRFTMTSPGTALILDDRRVVHETTPIQPDGESGFRDTLVVTYRAGGFMEPE